VPLHYINADICAGVKVGGGVVQHIMNDIEVQCLPDELPEFIAVDLSELQVGHSLHVNELTLPGGVELIARVKHDNPGVVTVQLPRAVAAEEEVAAGPVTEITGQKPEDAAGGEKKDGAKDAPKKDAEKK
jgi:large subunit ribosomal protein L25